jgi:hypothetical protein
MRVLRVERAERVVVGEERQLAAPRSYACRRASASSSV